MNTNDILNTDRIPTIDELRAFFKENDWTTAILIDKEDRTPEMNADIAHVKKLMEEQVEPLAREKGQKKSSKSYSKDFPLTQLRDGAEDVVASAVYKLVDEHPDAVEEIFEQYGLFTDPDVHEKADEFLYTAIDRMLDVMQYEELAEIVNENPAPEDFRKGSRASQDFERQYYHSRTKHPQVSLEGLPEEIPSPDSDSIEKLFDELNQEAVREFWKTLNETDKKILTYRIKGWNYDSIAEVLGFKTHSAVIKRRAKIKKKFMDFLSEYI